MRDRLISPKNKRPFVEFAAGIRKGSKLIASLFLMTGIAFAQTPKLTNHSERDPDSALADEILDAHNAVRIKLKLPLLEWSDGLAASSRKWANTLVAQDRFYINPDTPYGQNLFIVTGGSASPAAVVWNWASESRNYDYDSNTCTRNCGHYTQLVWKSTLRLGCAVARHKDKEIWVCEYDPPGNVSGRSPY